MILCKNNKNDKTRTTVFTNIYNKYIYIHRQNSIMQLKVVYFFVLIFLFSLEITPFYCLFLKLAWRGGWEYSRDDTHQRPMLFDSRLRAALLFALFFSVFCFLLALRSTTTLFFFNPGLAGHRGTSKFVLNLVYDSIN